MKFKPYEAIVQITDLNEHGFGVGQYNNKELQVLDALPGEELKVRVYKKRRRVLFADLLEILKPSPLRLPPQDDHFTSCACWQILPLSEENKVKKKLIQEHYTGIPISDFDVVSSDIEYKYRNKAEFCFYIHADEHITLAMHKRKTSFFKYPIESCALYTDEVNQAAQKIVTIINKHQLKIKQLDQIMLKYSFLEQKVIIVLSVRDAALKAIFEQKSILDETIKGFVLLDTTVRHAPVIAYQIGELELNENILGNKLTYSYDNFFQTNPPVFEKAAADILNLVKNIPDISHKKVVDLYSGVGTIGLIVAKEVGSVVGVDLTPDSKKYSEINAQQNSISNAQFVEAPADDIADEWIQQADVLIVDPPRPGLGKKVMKNILEHKPKYIVYLSCNPKTQAENIEALKEFYHITFMRAYNFYPHTPHVECLTLLMIK